MWWLAVAVALADAVNLQVGVLRVAGEISAVVPDAGVCLVGEADLECITDQPVQFRWEGDPAFVLVGDTLLLPGESGRAWVLARDEDRVAERARMSRESIDLDGMLELWIRTGAHTPPVPSRGMFDDLFALVDHPDKRVRRYLVEALWPWLRDTASDPLSPEAPEIVPAGLLLRLSRDRDKSVRRRLAALLRDVREGERTEEGGQVLLRLLDDPNPGVRRVATASVSHAIYRGMIEPRAAWSSTLSRVPQPIPVGRRAAAELAKLHAWVGPEDVDAAGALDLVLRFHPEKGWRYWSAWRAEVPFEPERALRLLRDTVGLDRALLQHWARTSPGQLAALLQRWEPSANGAYRRDVVFAYVAAAQREGGGQDVPHDSLSPASVTPVEAP